MKKIIVFIVFILISLLALFIIMPNNVSGAPICTPENLSDIRTKYENGNAAVGIDVSAHQGDINWSEVARSGVKFAFIRCGYRGLTGGGLFSDKCFKKNIEGALANNIYVGVYIYSTAINETEAIAEANYCLECVKGYDIKYGIAYDFENFLPDDNRTDNLPLTQIRSNAHAFIKTIRDAGYEAVLYGSVSYLKNEWNLSEFDVPIWAAHYRVSNPSFTGHSIWQYSDAGLVPGISTYTDIDIDYTYYFRYNNIDINKYMFDSEWYAATNPDVRRAFGTNTNLLKTHYYNYGKKEGRSPTPFFDPKFYAEKYPDLQKAFGDNYVALTNHYIDYGSKEGRQGSKYFNPTYYLAKYNDVKKAYYSSNTRALEHFILYGMSEGRQGSEEFNSVEYKPTVSIYYTSRIGNNYKLYMAIDRGKPILDNPSIDISNYMFDAEYYYNKYKDLQNAFGDNAEALRTHYYSFGIKEGRSASPIFDPKYYYNAYPDLQKAFGENYEGLYNHFVTYGSKEGRNSTESFHVKEYLSNYKDLEKAFGNNYTKLFEHYYLFGFKEGRNGITN